MKVARQFSALILLSVMSLEWLAQRRRHWERVVAHCEEEYRRARAALNDCLQSEDDDCSGPAEWMRQANAALHAAQHELQTVQHYFNAVRSAAEDYRRQAHRLAQFLERDLPAARAFLIRKINILNAYAALYAGSNIAVPAVRNTQPYFDEAMEHSSIADLASGSRAIQTEATFQGTTSNWVNIGIQDVPLALIDVQDPISGPEDFRKPPYYDGMLAGMHKLIETVYPAVLQGAEGDDFSALDAQQGLDYQHGYRAVYDAFYGDDSIKLTLVNGRYDVTNGRHRIYLAQLLQWKSLPAKVSVQSPDASCSGDVSSG